MEQQQAITERGDVKNVELSVRVGAYLEMHGHPPKILAKTDTGFFPIVYERDGHQMLVLCGIDERQRCVRMRLYGLMDGLSKERMCDRVSNRH